MQTFYTPVSTYVKASALQRIIAAFIDGLVGHVPFLVLMIVSSGLFAFGYAIPVGYLLALAFSGNLISVAYLLTKDALPFLKGQSIGKRLMGIKAVKEDSGSMLTHDYGTSIIRQVPLFIPFFNIIDVLLVFSDEQKRFGDKWAKTVVIKA